VSEPTFIPLNTGDVHDDDANIIDDMFIPNPMGLTTEEEAISPVVNETAKVAKPNRLTANSLLIASGATISDPVQVAWPDPNRKSLTIVIDGAAADKIYVADQATKLGMVGPGIGLALRLSSSMLPVVLPGYTGALYLRTDATPMSGALLVSVVSVTE